TREVVSVPFMLLLQAPQRPLSVREVRRIQHLNTGMVLAVERCDVSRAASFLRIVWRVEPQTQMIDLHWRSRWVCCRIIVEYLGCRGDTGSDNEGLDVEAPPEILLPDAIVIGFDIALVPRQAEGCIRNLDHEKVETGVAG